MTIFFHVSLISPFFGGWGVEVEFFFMGLKDLFCTVALKYFLDVDFSLLEEDRVKISDSWWLQEHTTAEESQVLFLCLVQKLFYSWF